jgi:alginate O-acetyltransferase complex protein AlgI
MLFSSTVFLFGFLPVVLTVALALRSVAARNVWLLLASLLFYAWGELAYTAILLASVAFNYCMGLAVERVRGSARSARVLGVAVVGNLALLGGFKYANFAVDNWNALAAASGLPGVELAPIHLPIGISFFTFQALSYVVDVHRGDAPVERDPLRVGLYIALFPQLIAGPIVRFAQVAGALRERHATLEDLSAGARRFVVGLGKKVLIANTIAVPVDRIYALPPDELSASLAWAAAAGYALQILFDFSGYSDMAIGLGRMLGFRFPENFRFPYAADSIREFWRRWHISLSSWFRDYLYIPLGGSRVSPLRTARNLMLVFLLCGLWHGASWNFVIWGALHGGFLALERGSFGAVLSRLPAGLRHLYVVGVVLVAWVFFRAETLDLAAAHLGAMVGLGAREAASFPLLSALLTADVVLASLVGVLASTPLFALLAERLETAMATTPALRSAGGLVRFGGLAVLLVGCAMSIAAGTHDPFIYFRF